MIFRMHNKMIFFLLLGGFCGILSCKTNEPKAEIFDPMAWVETLEVEEGTAGMTKVLDTIHQYFTSNNLTLLSMRVPSKQKVRKPGYMELYNGETKKAIAIFEKAMEKKSALPADQLQQLLHILGIAYFRLGEQENCIHNHHPESCILPIRKSGQHQIQEGSLKAIEIYKELLEKFPEDQTAKYLLNLAYMTLGKYPEEVPDNFRVPLTYSTKNNTTKSFINIASKTGVDVRSLCGGAILEDFNNDGNLDMVVSGWSLQEQIQLFISNGKDGFDNKTAEANLSGLTGGLNMICADYNNDGFKDIFVLRGAWRRMYGKIPNSLLKNNGDGTFTDVTKAAGVLDFAPTQTAVFADFDNDGWLDLFIGNESKTDSNFPCVFYKNNKNGTFSNVSDEMGLNISGFVKGVAAGDFNNDGWMDLYISRLRNGNLLYKNNDGIKFEEVTQSAGVTKPDDSFPCWFWDYNNDGWLDLCVAGYTLRQGRMSKDILSYYSEKSSNISNPVFYKNNGDGTFSDETEKLDMQIPIHTMGANFGDIDNDGFPDAYFGTGEPDFRSIIPNRLFLNITGEKFEDITTEAGVGHIQKGHGIAFGDIDNDGDQDILAEMGGAADGDIFQNALFENPNDDNNWIHIILEGKISNRDGIGARIKILRAGEAMPIYKMVSAGGSFGSNSMQQEIGLGKATQIKTLEIFWPSSNTKQIFNNIKINQRIKITEGEESFSVQPLSPITFKSATKKPCH